jgi:hypothetical protein
VLCVVSFCACDANDERKIGGDMTDLAELDTVVPPAEGKRKGQVTLPCAPTAHELTLTLGVNGAAVVIAEGQQEEEDAVLSSRR